MDPQQALPHYTSYALRETSRFLRHLASACDLLDQTGSLPPSLFAAAPAQPGPGQGAAPQQARGRGYGVGPDSAEIVPQSPSSMPSPPKTQKRRKTEKRTRAPTGYNVFVQQKLEAYKQEGLYSQYPDSKAAFKAAVEEWRNLPEEERQRYLDEASAAARAAKQEDASLPAQEVEPAGALSQPLELQQAGIPRFQGPPRSSLQQQLRQSGRGQSS